MIKGHKIERKIEINEFLEIIRHYDKQNVDITNHTTFRLSDELRKVFKDDFIKEFILHTVPILVGLQFNKCYAVFYRFQKEPLRFILDIQPNKVGVVTFYAIDEQQIPRI